MDCLQHLCAIGELFIPAFVGPDEMGDVVNDIDTMFDQYQSITQSGDWFGVPAFVFQSVSLFLGFLNAARQQIQ